VARSAICCCSERADNEVVDVTDEEVEALVLTAPCADLLGRRLLGHDEDRGWIKFGFEGKPEFLNPAGRVQGGILTAMLDDTMGPSCCSRAVVLCIHPQST
jgi:acyl-coenzyme A thioesterase PaaI-like protein